MGESGANNLAKQRVLLYYSMFGESPVGSLEVITKKKKGDSVEVCDFCTSARRRRRRVLRNGNIAGNGPSFLTAAGRHSVVAGGRFGQHGLQALAQM